MSGSGYRLAEIFAIRPTGVPFEALEDLATPGVVAAARDLLAREAELGAAVQRAAAAAEGAAALTPAQRHRLRRKLFRRAPLPARPGEPGELPELAPYRGALAEVDAARWALDAALARELDALRGRLYARAAEHLPELAVLQLTGPGLRRMLEQRTPDDDRTLAIWIQRVCAKNDTISRFGPSAWGTIDPDEPGLRLAPRPGIAARVVWVERWVVRAVIDAINADAEARPELAPRAVPAPAGVDADADAGAASLDGADRALLARCDGRAPAHALGDPARLAALAERGLVRWQLESIYMDNAPLETLAADVAAWRDGPARRRWAAVIERLAAAAEELRAELDPARRQGVLDRVAALVVEVGGAPRQRTGRLYEAANPLVENCSREGDFALGAGPAAELARDAAPWFELFRDACAVAADRVYDGLLPLYREAPRRGGRVLLGELLAFGHARGADLGGVAQARLAEQAFAEIRAGFARRLAGRPDAPAWELTLDECRFLRGRATPRPELGYPSADLQLAAASPEAVARGEYRWVVSELHHELAPMGRSLVWSCPDRPRLAARLRDAHRHAPTVFFDSAGALHAPVHVSNEAVLEALAPLAVVTDHRTKPGWGARSPASVEVVLDVARRDLRARCLATGADLGTMLPLPRFFFGLHPFFPLQLAPHTPRLYRGRTVLQRRAWVIAAAELEGAFAERSPQLAVAIERLRAARDLPRWVFLRLRSDVLSTANALDRRKDAKPICIDLESYVFVEIFARRLQKYGAVELVEMLPAPDELVWREADGRRCFELRTLLVPAAAEGGGERGGDRGGDPDGDRG